MQSGTQIPLSSPGIGDVINMGMPVRQVPQAITAAPATSQVSTTSSPTPLASTQDSQPK